jgi:coenzyme F420-reducing hydrogenase beta subunit/polysaccharide pyruvyl transferase WcaK-like protein
MIENIEKTLKLNMCISCEICKASCPVHAISMKFVKGKFIPSIKKDTCINCGLCLSLCPGIHLKRKDVSLGPYIKSYTVYTKNNNILKKSASGGFVTTLVGEILRKKEFDGAFLLEFNIFKLKPARLKLFTDHEKVLSAAKSKYVPASAYNIIKKLSEDKGKKYIIVGTSCLIQGIKQFLREKNISEDNILFIGLFCDRTLNFNIYDYFEKTFGKRKEKLTHLDFRNKDPNGWPGDSKLFFNSGRIQIVNKSVRRDTKKYFQLNRCIYCLDKLNTSADISVGDCYIKEEADKLGKSSLIIRTEKGKKIFEKYSYLFSNKEENIGSVAGSQNIDEKRDRIPYVKDFIKQKQLTHIKKEIEKKQRKINWGESKQYFKIKIHRHITKIFKSTIPIKILLNILFRKTPEKNKKTNIIITGGNTRNKGAQAMVFSTVNYIKEQFPDKKIYVFSGKEEDRETYTFDILSYDLLRKIKIFSKKKSKYQQDEIIQILSNTDFVIDVSGYALTSQQVIYTNLNFLFNLFINRQFSLPCYYLSQSIGPFNYPFMIKILFYFPFKWILKYPQIIFIRENSGIKYIQRYTKKNIKKSYDIVLQSKKYNTNNIYQKKIKKQIPKISMNSIGIIPNQKVLEQTTDKIFYDFYQVLIETILKHNKNVYLLPHSNEDYAICEKIKNIFQKNDSIIILQGEFDCIDLEEIIKKFDFIVASRYHSIIHAYKNNVPAVILAWAEKYFELAKDFNQLKYLTDIRKNKEKVDMVNQIEKMLQNYYIEKNKISKILKKIKRENILNNFTNK